MNDTKCDPQKQICNGWQFDLIKVDQCFFFNNKTGIYVDSLNTDWGVSNSYFTAMAANAPGDSIHIKRATSFLIEQTFGGGYNETDQQGGTFINIGNVGSITIINSGSERSRRSIYTDPNGAISSMMMTIVGSVFSDPIELTGRINFVSTGNLYFAKTIQATSKVNITSTGDRFCWDPLITAGVCKDDAGRTINRPRFGDGHVMFQTGRVPEGNGGDVLERQPNMFGYDVEITDDKATSSEPLLFSRTSNPNRPVLRLGSQSQYYDFRRAANSGFLSITGNQEKPFAGIAINGPLQFDPNITFSDITKYASASIVAGQPVVTDGALVYCKDCRKDQSGVCTQGKAGTDGAFAKRINNKWRCD
jgi:hypothetical protein